MAQCWVVAYTAGGGRAEPDADGAAGSGQQHRLSHELGPDLAFGGPQCPAQPDLRAPFGHRDHFGPVLDDLPVVAKLRVCVCLRVEGTGEAGDAHELHEFVDIRVVDQLLGRQAVGCYGGLPSYFDLK